MLPKKETFNYILTSYCPALHLINSNIEFNLSVNDINLSTY